MKLLKGEPVEQINKFPKHWNKTNQKVVGGAQRTGLRVKDTQ